MYSLSTAEIDNITLFLQEVFDTREEIVFYPYMVNCNTYYNTDEHTLYANIIHYRAMLELFTQLGLTIKNTGVGYVLSIVS